MNDNTSISSDCRILLVDDTPTNLIVLKEALDSENYQLAFAKSGEKAIEIIPDLSPNLILLDIVMPGIDGYETCIRLKQNPKTQDIPIIFITAKNDIEDIVKGFQVGGVDFITKPFQKEEVCARIRNHLELQFLRKQNEERMKLTMARYLGSDLVDTLMESGDEVMRTNKQDLTIMFSDIRGFTSISEELDIEETVDLLKEYFSLMVECIHKEKGMLDKFIGDGIMAVFGAPLPLEDHADRGVACAISMVKTLNIFNERRVSVGKTPLQIGIGLNSAPVISGNIGSSERMDYTVIGDGVNTAARIEGACKYYKANILICEYTVRELQGSYQLRELDRVYFKGKAKPRRVFEVLDFHTEDTFPNLKEVLKFFNEGLKAFRLCEWQKALSSFKKSLELNPNDEASRLYILRCQKFIDKAPDSDWEGIWELESK